MAVAWEVRWNKATDGWPWEERDEPVLVHLLQGRPDPFRCHPDAGEFLGGLVVAQHLGR